MDAPDERERVTRHSYDNEMFKGEIEFAVDRKPPSDVRGRGGARARARASRTETLNRDPRATSWLA